MKFKGITTALVTPINNDGKVNKEQLKGLIQDQLKNNINGLLILGGTGEYTNLSMEQRKVAIDVTIKESDGKVPIMVGLLSPGLGDNIELGRYAKQAGADAVMAVTPFYVSPTEKGYIEYYKALDTALDMPVFLYNIPYKTGVNMNNNVVRKLVNLIPNVTGIKVCTDNIGDVLDLLHTVGDKISVLCGEDYRAVSSFIAGAPGAIVASSNLIPNIWVEIFSSAQNGDYKKSIALHSDYFPLMQLIFREGNPGPLKVALNLVNIPVGSVSVPLINPSPKTVEDLKVKMKELELI